MSGRTTDDVAQWLVEHAARKAPPALAGRLREEWLADLASRKPGLARLSFGLGCCWASRAIALEFGEAKVAAATHGGRSVTIQAPHGAPLFSRRATVLLIIIGVHVFLAYAVTSGLKDHIVRVLPADMVVKFIPPAARIETPPPPPAEPRFDQPRVEFVPPEIPDAWPVDAPPANTIAVEQPAGAPVTKAPEVPIAVKRVIGGPGKGFPATDDFYPADSRRRGEQGVAIARVCVDPSGRLTGQPVIAESSGSASLDQGALRLARAGSGRYRPTTEDGRPVDSCYAFRIKFQLSN